MKEASIPIDIPHVRNQLLENKAFLKKCFLAKSPKTVKDLISNASVNEVKLLLQILHLEVNHAIILTGKHIKPLERKIKALKKYFLNSGDYEIILRQSINDQKLLLQQFAANFRILLDPLFTPIKTK